MREGFSRYLCGGPGEPIRGMWISEGPNNLSHRRFICFFFFLSVCVCGFYESLSVVLLDSKSLILRKVSACPRGPKAFWFRLAKVLLEALHMNCIFICLTSFLKANIGLLIVYRTIITFQHEDIWSIANDVTFDIHTFDWMVTI